MVNRRGQTQGNLARNELGIKTAWAKFQVSKVIM